MTTVIISLELHDVSVDLETLFWDTDVPENVTAADILDQLKSGVVSYSIESNILENLSDIGATTDAAKSLLIQFDGDMAEFRFEDDY